MFREAPYDMLSAGEDGAQRACQGTGIRLPGLERGLRKEGHQQEVLSGSPGPLGPGREGGGMTGAGVVRSYVAAMLTCVLRNFLPSSWWFSNHLSTPSWQLQSGKAHHRAIVL